MAIFFTSDTHLGHANIIKYCQRPFLTATEQQMLADGVKFTPHESTVKRHDDAIIDNINACVGKEDMLWHLGDFCWGSKDKARMYRSRIKCQHVGLILGNHDQHDTEYVFDTHDKFRSITYGNQEVFLCHYPMRSWNKSHHGVWHFFGHVHGNLADIPNLLALDVGVDTHDFKPWSWGEIYEYMVPKIGAWNAYRSSWKDKELGGMKPGTHE